jgi:ribosomal protein L17
LSKVNTETQSNKNFLRKSVNALVTIAEQKDLGSETEYLFNIEYSDDATNKEITSLTFNYDNGSGVTFTNVTE